jgi:serine/threonine protein kinase
VNILFSRLGGYPPFSDEITEYSLHDQICQARYSFPDRYWSGVSDDGKDLIKRLLTLDPKKRISSMEALEHPWMQDEEVIGKARKIMEAATRNVAMPPPPQIPVRRYIFAFKLCFLARIVLGL